MSDRDLDPSDRDVLYIGQVRQLFVDHLNISGRTFDRYFSKVVKTHMRSMTPTESNQMQFMLRHEAMDMIEEFKDKGFRDAFT